jgi:D-beta-D-heptose 7-phosphate kinase/D-beta-D-heptose 1-phosphate adenosyltransferase
MDIINKITDIQSLCLILPHSRNGVVMTTGVYDILHEGHCYYLHKARKMGEILVVGLHSDCLVQERKGPNRPYFKEKNRAAVLTFFEFVDHIVIFETQEDVYEGIKKINPKILVVSETTEDEANSPLEMQKRFANSMLVKVLPPQSSLHTSQILKKINQDK